MTGSGPISFGARLSALAADRADTPAVTLLESAGGEVSLSWRELDQRSNQMARLLIDRGATPGRFVCLLLPTSLDHYVATLGAWKAGAGEIPLNPAMPERELDALLRLANPTVVVESAERGEKQHASTNVLSPLSSLLAQFPGTPLPDQVPCPGKAIASGGSTGRPKLIVDPSPWARPPGGFVESIGRQVGFFSNQIQLVVGPLYHNLGFTWGHLGLFEGQRLVVLERFDADRLLDAVERHRIEFIMMVPTMMGRVAASPRARTTDWSSIRAVAHSGAICPPAVKRAWIELVGPLKLYEAFGATEGVGITVIRGDEWLERPGSVGRPMMSDLLILGPDGESLAPGQVGEIFMRARFATGQPYRYLGAEPARTARDGYHSVGDLGWVDEAGYLYPADRRTDLIITGGANVYPAEVEAALLEHPSVRDAAVIGLLDPDWGKRVHAVIELEPGQTRPRPDQLEQHCRERLARYKVPKSYHFVDRLPRDEAGKLRRGSLLADHTEPERSPPGR
jgi:bile acid-coenzyme A ligase